MRQLFTAVALLFLASMMASGEDFLNDVKVVPGTNSATITWTSAVPAEVRVLYTPYTNTSYTSSTSRTSTYTLSHSVKLTGLSAGTKYRFNLQNFDQAGRLALATSTFTTLALSANLVDLSWDPSTSLNVVGYDVYRGTTSGGPYSRIANVPGAAYTDTSVAAGKTYYYVVTAVNSQNTQSKYSNQAVAIVP